MPTAPGPDAQFLAHVSRRTTMDDAFQHACQVVGSNALRNHFEETPRQLLAIFDLPKWLFDGGIGHVV